MGRAQVQCDSGCLAARTETLCSGAKRVAASLLFPPPSLSSLLAPAGPHTWCGQRHFLQGWHPCGSPTEDVPRGQHRLPFLLSPLGMQVVLCSFAPLSGTQMEKGF